ncbi:MAG: LON peptidase substrate-binding domain-containing protein [Verrucomicrobiia bacterium]
MKWITFNVTRKTDIPVILPILTLPNALLFPHAFLPLYLFEPQYCEMLRDCLAKHRMFGIALAKNLHLDQEDPEPNHIMGVGLIRACVNNKDETFHLILQGVARAEIIKQIQIMPYHMAKICILPNIHRSGLEIEALMIKAIELAVERIKHSHETPHKILHFLNDIKDPSILADVIGYNFVDDLYQKQRLLETVDVRLRLRRLISFLIKEPNLNLSEETPILKRPH